MDSFLTGHKYMCVYFHLWDTSVLLLLVLCVISGEESCCSQYNKNTGKNTDNPFSKQLAA